MSIFIELLQASLGKRSSLSRPPTAKEWELLFVECQKQSLVGVILRGISNLHDEHRPPKEVLLHWIGLVQLVKENYTLNCERARELSARFRSVGYRSCVLKGVGISQLYPDPEVRQCGDIDLWVQGDRKIVMGWIRSQCDVAHIVWHHVDAKFFDDVSTEIHFHPGWMYNPFCNKRLQKWFISQEPSQMTTNEALGFASPTVEFNAVYSLVHTFHHLIEEGVGLRHIVDYYYVLQSLPTTSRADVCYLLKRFGLFKLAKAMMWVLQSACGMSTEFLLCEVDEVEGRFLFDEIMRGGNFGYYRKDKLRRNSANRMIVLLPHYPREVPWVLPWKLWHKVWMFLHR